MLSLVDKNPAMEGNPQKLLNNNSQEAVELLGLSSSDSLDSPSFTHFQAPKQKRKVRFKKQLRSNSRSKSVRTSSAKNVKCTLWSCMRILAYFAAIAIIGALLWYVMTLSTRIQELQAKFSDIEAGSRNTPEALHVIHSNLKQIDSNVTLLYIEVKKNIADINNITLEVKSLKGVANNLKESIAAAPAIQQLPKDIKSLSEQIAMFGSKMNALESNVKELKEQQSNLQTTSQTLSGELDAVKVSVQDISNVTESQAKSSAKDLNLQKLVQEASHNVEYLQGQLLNVEKSMDLVNASLMTQLSFTNEISGKVETVKEAIVFLNNDTLIKNNHLLSLENYVHSNLSFRLEHLETSSPIQKSWTSVNDLQKYISDAIMQMINKDIFHSNAQSGNFTANNLEKTHDVLVLLAALLEEFNQLPSDDILTNKAASDLIKNMLQKSFDDMIVTRDIKIQEIEQNLHNLTNICTQNSQDQLAATDSSQYVSSTVPLPNA